MTSEKRTYKPFKIEIERNTNVLESELEPFIITINGERLKNVKRFYLDLDRDKIVKKEIKTNCSYIKYNPWIYGIEFENYANIENE